MQNFSIVYLKSIIPEGSTVYTTLISVSRSGMSRNFKCLAIVENEIHDISFDVARALQWKYSVNDRAVNVRGCGMDMAYKLVDCLGRVLYGSGESLMKIGI